VAHAHAKSDREEQLASLDWPPGIDGDANDACD
jgi:hypothetical protein